MMELDPQLQNISEADLQDFTVPHYPNFDQGYQSALYENGLAQFIAESNESAHLGSAASHQGPNGVHVNRNQNVALHASTVNGQSLNISPTNPRHPRHIAQHQAPLPFSNGFSSQTNAVRHPSQLQHTTANHVATTSPLTQRSLARSQSSHQQQAQSLPHQPPQRPQQPPSSRTHQTTPQKPASHPHPHAQPPSSPPTDPSQFTHPSTFPLIPHPPNLTHWREKFFNITEPLLLTTEEYHTYFPHVDNIYSHRSTQKYKKKPFVSHYWDCRLKGRPTGTPLSKLRKRQAGEQEEPSLQQEEENNTTGKDGDGGDGNDRDKEVKKRKRKTRERDLCDVKIKVTEFFGRDELEALGKLGIYDQGTDEGGANGAAGGAVNGAGSGGANGLASANREITFVHEDGISSAAPAVTAASGRLSAGQTEDAMSFGVLEPLKKLPEGHPGANGKRWYMVQRVNGSGKDDDDASLDHKHTMEESDRIKKNSVQRWLLAQEKEQKKQNKRSKNATEAEGSTDSRSPSSTSMAVFHASGKAQQTAKSHAAPASTQLTLYANSFCPFAQRIWIALEMKGIPYQYVEVTQAHKIDGKVTIPALLEVCPSGNIPCLKHGNWGVWESDVVLEYLEDLSIGHSLLPLGDPQLRAHSRLWKDHINRKIVPYFYALLLLPATDSFQVDGELTKPSLTEKQSLLVITLQKSITELVNASHVSGPFFLGSEISLVDVAFAPWIIRLSRVLEYYREFPKPEVGTRWKAWVDAIESNDAVRRTVSDEKSYHAVYGGVGKDVSTVDRTSVLKGVSEMRYAQMLVGQQGFGLGGDIWGTLLASEAPMDAQQAMHLPEQ